VKSGRWSVRADERELSRFGRWIGLLAGLLVLALSSTAVAEEATPTGRGLLDRVKQLNDTTRSWVDLTRRMHITIRDRRGGERNRDLLMRTRRGEGGEDKTLIGFESPPEIRGTSLLQFSHRNRDAEQWLFLPELGRVRTISAQSKDESFMGTDFSYRDLELLTDVTEWTEEEARSSLDGSETIEGQDVWLVALEPVVKDVGYERIVLALDKDELVLRRMTLYEEGKGKPVKVLDLNKIETVDGIPTARILLMRQPAEGTQTVVDVSDVRYNQSLPDKLFTQRALERVLEE
jgi:outer membrane lipoprotein-sorting protein